MKYAMKEVRKNGLSGATAIVTPLIFLMSLATRRFSLGDFAFPNRGAGDVASHQKYVRGIRGNGHSFRGAVP